MPVECIDGDDLIESTAAFEVRTADATHPAVQGLDWSTVPPILGFNETRRSAGLQPGGPVQRAIQALAAEYPIKPLSRYRLPGSLTVLVVPHRIGVRRLLRGGSNEEYMEEDWKEFRVSDDCKNDTEELRRRLVAEGYLFFKKLQNPDKLLALRRDMTRSFYDAGWLVAGTNPMDGIADPSRRCTEGDQEYSAVYHRMYRLESFHQLPHEPELTTMAERIMGRPVIALPGKKARLWFPQFTRAYDSDAPGLRPLPGDLRRLDLLVPGWRLPHRAWSAGGLARLAQDKQGVGPSFLAGSRRPRHSGR